jgi:hypothetical protein
LGVDESREFGEEELVRVVAGRVRGVGNDWDVVVVELGTTQVWVSTNPKFVVWHGFSGFLMRVLSLEVGVLENLEDIDSFGLKNLRGDLKSSTSILRRSCVENRFIYSELFFPNKATVSCLDFIHPVVLAMK